MSPHSVLCDRTAAWFHGVEVFRYAELETVPAPESFVLRGHDPTDRRGCHGGTRDLLPEDWTVVAGVIQARGLVPLTDPRSESSGESWTRLSPSGG